MILSLANDRAPMPKVIASTMRWLRAKRGLRASDGVEETVASAMPELPPHEAATECFCVLREVHFLIYVLLNGSETAVKRLVERAKFKDFFDGVHWVERAKRYKLHP